MAKRKVLFLGETYRADAITWLNGLQEFGDFEIFTWELKKNSNSLFLRTFRFIEYLRTIIFLRKIVGKHQPDIIVAERATSYGFLGSIGGVKPFAIAQQGISDLWPETSKSILIKKLLQKHTFEKADLIHAWGPAMTVSMKKEKVNMSKVMVLPKGIDLNKFTNFKKPLAQKITAIVTRSLMPEYRHNIILKAFEIINCKGFDFELVIVGDGTELAGLRKMADKLKISNKVTFLGRIPYCELPKLLKEANFYISMPITEGVSASLFEAMATNCYPVVTNILGNQTYINHRVNGLLIETDNFKMLADEVIWAFENKESRKHALIKNRKFIEEHANYAVNMKIIASKYHELINLAEKI